MKRWTVALGCAVLGVVCTLVILWLRGQSLSRIANWVTILGVGVSTLALVVAVLAWRWPVKENPSDLHSTGNQPSGGFQDRSARDISNSVVITGDGNRVSGSGE